MASSARNPPGLPVATVLRHPGLKQDHPSRGSSIVMHSGGRPERPEDNLTGAESFVTQTCDAAPFSCCAQGKTSDAVAASGAARAPPACQHATSMVLEKSTSCQTGLAFVLPLHHPNLYSNTLPKNEIAHKAAWKTRCERRRPVAFFILRAVTLLKAAPLREVCQTTPKACQGYRAHTRLTTHCNTLHSFEALTSCRRTTCQAVIALQAAHRCMGHRRSSTRYPANHLAAIARAKQRVKQHAKASMRRRRRTRNTTQEFCKKTCPNAKEESKRQHIIAMCSDALATTHAVEGRSGTNT